MVSPVGNRVTVFDLVRCAAWCLPLRTTTCSRSRAARARRNTTRTLPFETTRDIARVAVSPDGVLLLIVAMDGCALVINARRWALLHRFNFKELYVTRQAAVVLRPQP